MRLRRWTLVVTAAMVATIGVGAAGATEELDPAASEVPELPPAGDGWTRTDQFVQQPRVVGNGFGGRSRGLSAAGDTVAVGAPGDDRFTTDAGSVTVQRRTPLGWAVQVLRPPQPRAGGGFGFSVAMTTGVLAVGAPGEGTGQVHLYTRTDTGGLRLLQTLSGPGRFGHQVAMAGRVLVVGAPGAGRAMVFEPDAGGRWELWATLIAPSGAAAFGSSVAVDAVDEITAGPAWVAVGDERARSATGAAAGAVHLYGRQPEGWTWMQDLPSPTPSAVTGFGAAVDLRGAVMAVGAPLAGAATRKGSVYVYAGQSGTWSRTDTLRPATSTGPEYFGAAVNVDDGGAVAVGAPGVSDGRATGGAGAVYLYGPGSAGLTRNSVITPPAPQVGEGFGSSVQLDPIVVWAGSPGRDGGRGAAHRLVSNSCCSWREVHFVTASASSLPTHDRTVVNRLRNNRLRVVLVDDDALVTPGPQVGAVLISSSVSPAKVGRFYRTSSVPVVTWEPFLYDDLGFTDGRAGSQGETAGTFTTLTEDTPMNYGYEPTGAVTSTPAALSFARPAGTPRIYATVPGQPERAAMFGYEPGQPMAGGFAAPGIRFGLFLTYPSVGVLTDGHWRPDYWRDQLWFDTGGWGRFDSVVRCSLDQSSNVQWWECFAEYGAGAPT